MEYIPGMNMRGSMVTCLTCDCWQWKI